MPTPGTLFAGESLSPVEAARYDLDASLFPISSGESPVSALELPLPAWHLRPISATHRPHPSVRPGT
jgi:hypothetical protein